MKRTTGLITLFILTMANSISHLIKQSQEKPTLKEDVSNALANSMKKLPEDFDPDSIPDWVYSSGVECIQHYQEFGVGMFHMKTIVFLLSVAAVVLMFLWKKIGFSVYVLAQIISVVAVFYGLGLNLGGTLAAAGTAALSILFILLYKKFFLGEFKENYN